MARAARQRLHRPDGRLRLAAGEALAGSPAEQKAAIQAAQLGKRAAIVERRHVVGGVYVNTGMIPSKTLREAVIHLTDLFWRTQLVIQKEVDVIHDQLMCNHVTILCGDARFVDQHTVEVDDARYTSSRIVIATGTRPARPASVEFDDVRIIDSGGIRQLERLPESMVVVGADVIGFPSLAATSMEQGRRAACHAFGVKEEQTQALLPFGIYTIPETSYVGRTVEELTEVGVPYEVGIARYRELTRRQIVGDLNGLLKLLVDPETRLLLGVHVVGTGASEIVHIGQTVMGLGGTVDSIVNQVFNDPTLSEAYKVAALDASNKMRALSRVMESRKAA